MIKPDHDTEAMRRRDRTQQGRSPGQRTSRSEDKGRSFKRPGKGQRQRWRKLIDR
jgi:hypothetical protein